MVPAGAFVIRFPDGDYEYDMTRRPVPSVGDTLLKRGLLWSVEQVRQGEPVTIHVAPVNAPESKERPVPTDAQGPAADDSR